MTDPEITKLCAQAMGFFVVDDWRDVIGVTGIRACTDKQRPGSTDFKYNPLHNDAQAMELVKHLKLDIEPCFDGEEGDWMVSRWNQNGQRAWKAHGNDLNRAICCCVAYLSAPSTKGAKP